MKVKMMSIFMTLLLVVGLIGNVYSKAEGNIESEQIIEVAMSTDENYLFPTIVAITSILGHSYNNEFYNFYILLSSSLSQKNREDLLSLQERYLNCKIDLLQMNDTYNNCKTSGHITKAAYYRLGLPSILPEIDKVLYLDVDIIANKNIGELYGIDVDEYYMAGVDHPRCCDIGMGRKFLISVGITSSPVYVNSGILLMNLKKMREENVETAFYDCIDKNKNNGAWRQHDQDIINEVCNGKILLLPLKYNAMQHFLGKYNELKHPISEDEWKEAYTDPVIIHYSSHVKPWKDLSLPNANIWWKQAKITRFLEIIEDKFLK